MKMINLNPRSTKIIFLCGLFLIAIVLIVLSILSKKNIQTLNSLPQQPPEKSLSKPLLKTEKLVFRLPSNLPSVPESFSIKTYQTKERSLKELADVFKLTIRISNTQYSNTGRTENLGLAPSTNAVTYTNTPFEHFDANFDGSVDAGKALEAANEFIHKKIGQSLLVADTNKIKLYISEGAHLEEPADVSQAKIAHISYSLKLEASTFIGNQTIKPVAEVYVDHNYRITKATFYAYSLIEGESFSVKSIPVEKALENQNQMLVERSTNTDTYDKIDPKDYQEITLEKVEITYQLNPNNGLVYPLYYVEGTGITTKGDFGTVAIFVPATQIQSPN